MVPIEMAAVIPTVRAIRLVCFTISFTFLQSAQISFRSAAKEDFSIWKMADQTDAWVFRFKSRS
jgi:hypothetical protein